MNHLPGARFKENPSFYATRLGCASAILPVLGAIPVVALFCYSVACWMNCVGTVFPYALFALPLVAASVIGIVVAFTALGREKKDAAAIFGLSICGVSLAWWFLIAVPSFLHGLVARIH